MGPFLHALQNSAFSAWVVGSDTIWAYPMILTMHTVGLGIVVGAAVIIDLRLLGVGPGIPLEEVNRVFPIFWMGFFINLVSGVMLFVSGKLGTKPDGTLAGRTMREQTQQLLENIREALRHEGATMDDIVRVRVYATQVDAASLRDIHEVRSTFWSEGKYPASTLVRVSQLIRDGALIEIDADAIVAS